MLTLKRTDFKNPSFVKLVKLLDTDLKIRDGDEHAFYTQFNSIENLSKVVLAYSENRVVGCGALKEHNPNTMEIKRMFVQSHQRGKGIASMILKELEQWAMESNYDSCLLETGIRQPEAIALYKKNGYETVPNYGQYIGMSNSICFAKKL